MATWFTYEVCTDVHATQRFYGELIGLTQTWEDEGSVAFEHDCVQVSFQHVDVIERRPGWSFQPGWANGQLQDSPVTHTDPSISIALSPAAFAQAVDRLRASDVERLREEAFWVGYWSFVVKDPDGRTVELSDPVSGQTSDPTDPGSG